MQGFKLVLNPVLHCIDKIITPSTILYWTAKYFCKETKTSTTLKRVSGHWQFWVGAYGLL